MCDKKSRDRRLVVYSVYSYQRVFDKIQIVFLKLTESAFDQHSPR